MDFKAYSKSSSAFGGQVTWHILPFTTPLMDVRRARLNDLEPEWEFIEDKRGTKVYELPDAYRKALQRARKLKVSGWEQKLSYGGWTRRRLWGELHDNFLLLDTHTVAVDFALEADAPAELRLFAAYWQDCADAEVAERFQAFRYAVSAGVHLAWSLAFTATRDNPAPAPKELGEAEPDEDADPLAASDTDDFTPTTNSS